MEEEEYACTDGSVVLMGRICSPSNPGLLGLNIDGGREVRIRLRHYGRDWDFYPYESVLGTLLHELTHNECGPHDAKFYKLLDEITKVLLTLQHFSSPLLIYTNCEPSTRDRRG